LLVPVKELHRENFNLGDDKAAYFRYITSPIQDAYDQAIQTLDSINTGVRAAKHGILIVGEANAGKTRLAFEALSKILPEWFVIQWNPGNSTDHIPAHTSLNGHDVVVFIDDLQKYVSIDSAEIDTSFVNREKVETIHLLLRSVRASAKRFAIIATCRIEDEVRADAELGELFEELKVVRLKRFSQDAQDIEAAKIIEEFKIAGAEHTEDWDGTLGSLVLGLSRKARLYHDLVQRSNPSAMVLRAMKLLTWANVSVHTEQRLKAVCAGVFGEKELQQDEKVWRATAKQLKLLQFVTIGQNDSEVTLTIRKDDYFEKVINDYSQSEIEQDFGKLQRVFVEINDAEALTDLSYTYFTLTLYQDSLRALNQSLAINPNKAPEWYLKGCMLGILDQPEEALISFDKSLDINPRYSLAWKLKGVTFSVLERPKDALLSFEESLSLNPDDAETWHKKGHVLLQLERPEEALTAFEKTLTLDPTATTRSIKPYNPQKGRFRSVNQWRLNLFERRRENADTWFDKGHALLLMQRYEEALVAFEQALALNSDNVLAWFLKGMTLRILKQPQEALAAFEQSLFLDPKATKSWMMKGETLLALEKQEEALTAYDQALALDPNDAETLALKGKLLYSLDRNEEALTVLNQALALDPDDVEILGLKGHSLARLKRSEESFTTFDQALAFDSNNAETLALKGHSLYLLERYEEALVTVNQALALNPDNALAWQIKGHIYFAIKQFENALTAFNQALALDPNDSSAWFLKGLTLELLERPEEGLTALEQALTLSPNKVNILAAKGEALFRLKRFEESLAAFEQALVLNPDDTELRESKLEVLQMLHSETDGQIM